MELGRNLDQSRFDHRVVAGQVSRAAAEVAGAPGQRHTALKARRRHDEMLQACCETDALAHGAEEGFDADPWATGE